MNPSDEISAQIFVLKSFIIEILSQSSNMDKIDDGMSDREAALVEELKKDKARYAQSVNFLGHVSEQIALILDEAKTKRDRSKG